MAKLVTKLKNILLTLLANINLFCWKLKNKFLVKLRAIDKQLLPHASKQPQTSKVTEYFQLHQREMEARWKTTKNIRVIHTWWAFSQGNKQSCL
jgi:hypothetical protein